MYTFFNKFSIYFQNKKFDIFTKFPKKKIAPENLGLKYARQPPARTRLQHYFTVVYNLYFKRTPITAGHNVMSSWAKLQQTLWSSEWLCIVLSYSNVRVMLCSPTVMESSKRQGQKVQQNTHAPPPGPPPPGSSY